MQFDTAKPSGILSKYVKSYWGIANNSPLEPYLHRIVPHGLPELMFYLNHKPEFLDDKKDFAGQTILSGHQKAFYDLRITDALELISVTFFPHAAHLFFDIPFKESYNINLSLNDIAKESIKTIEDKLYHTRDFKKRVMIIEHFLLSQLKKNYQKYELDRITHALSLINYTKGKMTIDDLAKECCLSRKQFERTFNHFIGSSPKQFIKTIRFQQTLFQKQNNPSDSLTELAHQTGYFDQSHMINEFKSLTGQTPKAYFKDCDPFSDYFG
jgi:AraC-like DNA-binding protein